jgi:hypothetical protein
LPRPFVGEIRPYRPARALEAVAAQAARLGHQERAFPGFRRQALCCCPFLDELIDLAGGLLGRCALVREHPHRRDHEQGRNDRDRAARNAPFASAVVERNEDEEDERDRRDADRAEEDGLRPLEDSEQVEEEVEVPVGARSERSRTRIGLFRVARAEHAGVAGLLAGGEVPESGEPHDHPDDDEAHDRVVEHRVRVERLPAPFDVLLVELELAALLFGRHLFGLLLRHHDRAVATRAGLD